MFLSSSAKEPFFDPKFQAMSLTVLPGEFMVSNTQDMMLVTILGSCIAACIHDPEIKFGGINHFFLAEPSAEITSRSSRYGCFAMECLINEILKKGGDKNRMEAKIFGGSELFKSRMRVGSKNAEFVKSYLKKEGIKVIAEDLGGSSPRRIHYWPYSGRTVRHMIKQHRPIIDQESLYQKRLKEQGDDGGIELF